MKKDMVDLKKLVLRAFSEGGNATQMMKENPELFEGIDAVPAADSQLLNYNAAPIVHEETDEEEVHDITQETEYDSLSIEKKEKELILRALQKNNNRRKNAARDLGISERTLYRKIKQYDLEE